MKVASPAAYEALTVKVNLAGSVSAATASTVDSANEMEKLSLFVEASQIKMSLPKLAYGFLVSPVDLT